MEVFYSFPSTFYQQKGNKLGGIKREVLMAKCGGKYDIDDFQTMLLFLYFLAKGIWKTLCQLLFDPK